MACAMGSSNWSWGERREEGKHTLEQLVTITKSEMSRQRGGELPRIRGGDMMEELSVRFCGGGGGSSPSACWTSLDKHSVWHRSRSCSLYLQNTCQGNTYGLSEMDPIWNEKGPDGIMKGESDVSKNFDARAGWNDLEYARLLNPACLDKFAIIGNVGVPTDAIAPCAGDMRRS
jgi:hypothetical protein